MALVLEWGKFWKGVFVLIRPLKRIYSITTKLTLIGRKCKGVKPLKEEWIWDKPCTWVSFALREPQHLHVYTCSVPLAELPQQNMEPRHHCLFQLPGNVGCLGIGTGPNASRFPRLHKTTFRASSLGHLAWPKKRLGWNCENIVTFSSTDDPLAEAPLVGDSRVTVVWTYYLKGSTPPPQKKKKKKNGSIGTIDPYVGG